MPQYLVANYLPDDFDPSTVTEAMIEEIHAPNRFPVFDTQTLVAFRVRGVFMRKIRIIEHISLDGVIQAPGGPKEDGDYPYGGWAAPHEDPEGGAAIVAAHGEDFDLLLGRRTYDIWSAFWPKAEKSPMADNINAATKYIATHRPDSLEWGPVEDLGKDIVQGVRRVKAKAG